MRKIASKFFITFITFLTLSFVNFGSVADEEIKNVNKNADTELNLLINPKLYPDDIQL